MRMQIRLTECAALLLTLLSAQDRRRITRNDADAQIFPLLPRIWTVFRLFIVKVKGHHSDRQTHDFVSKSSSTMAEFDDQIRSL